MSDADALAALNRDLAAEMGWTFVKGSQPLRGRPDGGSVRAFSVFVPDFSRDLGAVQVAVEYIREQEPEWAYRVEYDPIAEMWSATWIPPYSRGYSSGFTAMLLYAERAVAEARAALAALRAMKEATP